MDCRIEKAGATADILVVEDNPGDARLLEEYLSDEGITNPIHHVGTVEDALDFVYQRGEYADAPSTDLVFLDWHLPKANGDAVVERLAEDPELDGLLVVVLTGSMRDPDSIVPSDLGVDGYFTKPIDTDELLDFVESSDRLSLVRP